ncbi:MAG: 1-acyl-sn-glycerol-3-phosphate acyltransferase [Bellilinea sp.]|nr:1-acyl-sn-glycerol-3-phosphate acyltransferase [Bellilinea sp.]
MTTSEIPMLSSSAPHNIADLYTALEYEVFRVSGWTEKDWRRRILGKALERPLYRMAEILAGLDEDIRRFGLNVGLTRFLEQFSCNIEWAAEQPIPQHGPLIVACNHPGTFDGFVLANLLQREDVRVISREMPLLRNLPQVSRHLIFSTRDMSQRVEVLREVIQHLKDGGVLLTFPRGTIEPDPATMPGAMKEVRYWLPSLELWLRKVPETRLVIGIISQVTSPLALKVGRLFFRKRWNAQLAAEVVQVAFQVLAVNRWKIQPRVTFSAPLSLKKLESELNGERRLFPLIQAYILRAMAEHQRLFYGINLPV